MQKNKKETVSPFTRAEILKKKVIPPTKEQVLIVKCNNGGLGFRYDCYPTNLLAENVPKEMFDSTVMKPIKFVRMLGQIKKNKKISDFHPFVLTIYRSALFFTFFGLLLISVFSINNYF